MATLLQLPPGVESHMGLGRMEGVAPDVYLCYAHSLHDPHWENEALGSRQSRVEAHVVTMDGSCAPSARPFSFSCSREALFNACTPAGRACPLFEPLTSLTPRATSLHSDSAHRTVLTTTTHAPATMWKVGNIYVITAVAVIGGGLFGEYRDRA